MIMDLQHQIRALAETDRRSGIELRGNGPGSPPPCQRSGETRAAEAAIASARRACGQFASDVVGIREYQRMMDDAPVAGPKFDGAHVRIAFEIQRDYEAPVLIGSIGCDGKCRWHGENLLWLAQLPTIRECG